MQDMKSSSIILKDVIITDRAGGDATLRVSHDLYPLTGWSHVLLIIDSTRWGLNGHIMEEAHDPGGAELCCD